MEKIDVKVWLKGSKTVSADSLQQPARLPVTSHHQMLSIVDDIARRFIKERIRPASEMLPLFKHQNRDVARRQVDSSTQPTEATAEDNHVIFHGELTLPPLGRELGSDVAMEILGEFVAQAQEHRHEELDGGGKPYAL
jgi:hypothetical protein